MKQLHQRSQYPLAVDCVIFGYANGVLKVALIERKKAPFIGSWALPGGFICGNETVEEGALRELQEETGIHDIYLEQCGVWSAPDRDPRGRIITVAFFALIAADQTELVATEDAERAAWFPINKLPALAFDHTEIYAKALESLRIAVTIKPLVFTLLPQEFTLSMLQHLYEQIFGYAMDKRNFRKKILTMDFIQETANITRGGKHRPAKLYRFNQNCYIKTHPTTIYSPV